jgi:hypothetical protein
MIFTVAIISPSTTGLKAGSVANVIASSTRLSRSIASAVHHQHAGPFGEQVGAAGEGAVDAHALARHGPRLAAAASSSDTSPGSSAPRR